MQNLKEFASKKVLSPEEMHAVELNCSSLHVGTIQLMENAGSAVANFVKENLKAKNILFFCGTGNNGGDGFVAARLLSKEYNVSVIIVGNKEIKQGPALANFAAISSSPFINLFYYTEMEKKEINKLIRESDLIIDAIFGTGFKGELKGVFKEAVELINNSKKKVLAIDVPSGFNEGSRFYVNADYTITFHKLKKGMQMLKPKPIVKDIGIPIEAELFTGPGDLYLASKPISRYANKRDRGTLIIIGGSKIYHGAPMHSILAANALSSLRVGAGYTVLYAPEKVADLAKRISANLVVKSLGNEYILFNDELKDEIERANAVAIGMGITKSKAAQDACREIVSYASSMGKKVIVDADGIGAIASLKDFTNILITPHDGEFYAFSKIKLEHENSYNLAERVDIAKKVAKEKGVNILLKGHNSIITDGEEVKINIANTSNLSTMGSGDVLSGIVGAFAAAGSSLFEAAAAASYLHAKAGELLSIEKGNHIIASDLIDVIPKILREFDQVD